MDALQAVADQSLWLTLLCVLVGAAYAFLLYAREPVGGRRVSVALFLLRAALVSIVAFLLLDPGVKRVTTQREKPVVALCVDNSASVGAALDSAAQASLRSKIDALRSQLDRQGYAVSLTTLDEKPPDPLRFNHLSSDLSAIVTRAIQDTEGKKLAGLALVSDGIYNAGLSPLHLPMPAPIYTVGVGDTVAYADAAIRSAICNEIVRLSNHFTVRIEALTTGISDREITAVLYRNGKPIAEEKKNVGAASMLTFNFEIEAAQKGLQRMEVRLSVVPGEKNIQNNRATLYTYVVENERSVWLVSPTPHPDIKAIAAALQETTNYKVSTYVLSVDQTASLPWRQDQQNYPDVIALRYTRLEQSVAELFHYAFAHEIPLLVMMGENADAQLETLLDERKLPIAFERMPWSRDATMEPNVEYSKSDLLEGIKNVFKNYPPVRVSLAPRTYPADADVILSYRDAAGSHPLLFIYPNHNPPLAFLLGEGIWRWRMSEFAESGSAMGFDEMIQKLTQYLGSHEPKRRFRSFPISREFTAVDPVIFENRAYNRLLEPLYDYPVTLRITDEVGKTCLYRYTVGSGGSRYTVGAMTEGAYQYEARAELPEGAAVSEGGFRVASRAIEMENLTADFALLRAWAQQAGGAFYSQDRMGYIALALGEGEETIVKKYEHTTRLLSSIWLLLALVLWASIEWAARKLLRGEA